MWFVLNSAWKSFAFRCYTMFCCYSCSYCGMGNVLRLLSHSFSSLCRPAATAICFHFCHYAIFYCLLILLFILKRVSCNIIFLSSYLIIYYLTTLYLNTITGRHGPHDSILPGQHQAHFAEPEQKRAHRLIRVSYCLLCVAVVLGVISLYSMLLCIWNASCIYYCIRNGYH